MFIFNHFNCSVLIIYFEKYIYAYNIVKQYKLYKENENYIPALFGDELNMFNTNFTRMLTGNGDLKDNNTITIYDIIYPYPKEGGICILKM